MKTPSPSSPSGCGPTATGSASPAWVPVLSGRDRDDGEAALAAIAADLTDLAAVGIPGSGLNTGRPGVAVFLAYHAAATGDARGGEAALALLDESIAAASREPHGASLSGGLTGLAWSVTHLCGTLLPAQPDDPVDAVDAALTELLADPAWATEAELLYGLAGFGVWALERLPRPAAAALVDVIVGRLEGAAQRRNGGVVWAGDDPPEPGAIDLGVAHGLAGTVAFLARAVGAGIAAATASALLDPAVDWLLAQRADGGGGTTIPPYSGRDLSERTARAAWCYGDLGVGAALLAAARHAARPGWEEAARAMALRAAARPDHLMRLTGTGLCHGSAGAAHVFNRMYQATREQELGDAAARWFRVVLDARHPSDGIGGFGALRERGHRELEWWADPGLLNGAAGVGLALLAALYPVVPEWDRTLAIAPPHPR